MGKLTIQDIAAVLVERNGLKAEEAHAFASAMFNVVQERLETDQQVKVKGLGTFKIIDVEARESVSVRTGERVMIDSHSKVSFTPDATMKELVNKPFSQFETVVLNDGVKFDDIKEEAPVVAETLIVETPSFGSEEEPALVDNNPATLVNNPATLVNNPATLVDAPAETPSMQPELQSDEGPVIDDEEEARPWGHWLMSVLGVFVLMALSAFGGYYYGIYHRSNLEAVPDTMIVHDTVMVSPTDTVVAPVREFDEEQTLLEPESAVNQEESIKAEPVQETVDKYATKDARVRLGAYRIVGTEREVKVLAGQTFYSICRANLGPDMECYVEVYNDLPRNPTIKEGQFIKIPKLQLKKKRKQ